MSRAWLLDDGTMCLGVHGDQICPMTYTDESALRFSRASDANNFRLILAKMELAETSGLYIPREHSWS